MRLLGLILCGLLTATAVRAADNDAVRLADTIDRHVGARWKDRDVRPAAIADDGEFLRRVYLDLVGHIPPINEVRDFLDDTDPNKRQALIDRLLSSDRHAQHLGAVWSAMMVPQNSNRQFRGTGFEAWLRRRLAARAGYDTIAREVVTGVQGSQGFIQANENKPENVAAATSRIFLGIKLECAQCHDHPFQKWKRQQFWEFAAFFTAIGNRGNRALKAEITIPGTGKTVQAKFLDEAELKVRDGEDGRVVLADWLTSPKNPFFARAAVNRLWEYFFGIGIIDPVDEPGDDNPPSHPELLDELAKAFAEHEFDVRHLIRGITLSKTYQLTSKLSHESQKEPRVFARTAVRGLSPEQLFDSLAEAIGPQAKFDAGDPRRLAPGGFAAARQEFLARFPNQDRRTEMQTSILQALYLMNGKFTADATTPEKNDSLAKIAEARGMTTARRVEELYMITLSRRPTAEESARLVKYIDKGGETGDRTQALADVFWALLNSSEFFLNH